MSQKMTIPEAVKTMEDRFKIVTSLAGSLDRFPIYKEDQLDFLTDREKSRQFAEVFTPIYMVDEMIGKIPDLNTNTRNIDLCAGHGQFTIRMLRKFLTDDGLNLRDYLMKRHFFCELQLESAWKIIWVFGSNINLAIGSALELHKLPANWRGIWLYAADTWVPITGTVKAIRPSFSKNKIHTYSGEEHFVRVIKKLKQKFESISEGYMNQIEQIISTSNGRRHFLEECSKAASGIEENWQDKMTPEWVCKEMVDCIPGGVTGLKKILVLFNAEFLEVLVKQKKVNPRNIDFAFDSKLEGLFASKVYRVNTFSVGKTFKEMCEALEGKGGRYDIVISNPPYQVQSEAQKGRKGGGSIQAKPIYHEIVMHAIDKLQPRYVCMITPSRWMVGGMGLGKYRSRMLADRRIRMIQDFPGAFDVFSSVKIESGVSYFLWDQDYNGDCEFNSIPRKLDEFDILVRDNTAVSILKKVLKKHQNKPFCNGRVLPNKPFGLPTNFKDWVEKGTEGAVKCVTRGKATKYVTQSSIQDYHSVQRKWKTATPAAYGENTSSDQPLFNLKGTFILEKDAVCTETYVILGSFCTKAEAINYRKYANTKFYRFMVGFRKSSQHINKQKFAWVPDFGDYTVEYTDQDLYEHFGLTKREIDHIEKTIKSLD